MSVRDSKPVIIDYIDELSSATKIIEIAFILGT